MSVAFLDELASGIGPASTPDIAASLGVSAGVTAGVMIVAFHSLAIFVEAPLLAWSERVSARWFSAGSLCAVALSTFLAAAVPRGWVLLLALAAYGPASGCALSVAEGLLVEANPTARERTMARVSLAANAGDLAVPLLLGLLARCGFGWRTACTVAGAVALLLACAHACARSIDRRPSPESTEDDDATPAPTLRDTLHAAVANRPLLGWSFACALTGLLDEVLVAFSAIHLQAMGASVDTRSTALAGWVLGGFVGAGAIDRFVEQVGARRLLVVVSSATGVGVAVLALTRSPFVATAALFFIGVAGSTLHPLAKARAYAALPNRPAIVNAVASLLLLFDMSAPMVLGAIATKAGSAWAIAAILVAPVGVATAAIRLNDRGSNQARTLG